MWSVIQEISMARKQAAVILTTHSMEECEALCNKLTVMVNGSFRCFGTHKEVKDRYGAGRQLSVKIENATIAAPLAGPQGGEGGRHAGQTSEGSFSAVSKLIFVMLKVLGGARDLVSTTF